MVSSFNFEISSNGFLSKLCRDNNLSHFQELCNYIKLLPYGRNSDKNKLSLVITEKKGTCSTKHAFLAEVAQENRIETIALFIGVYKMSNENTPGIGDVLLKNNLEYIPEAHNYLKYNNVILDYTSRKDFSFKEHLLYEEQILPKQITDYKINLHQTFIKKWIVEACIPFSFEDIWDIREQCISNLSQ